LLLKTKVTFELTKFGERRQAACNFNRLCRLQYHGVRLLRFRYGLPWGNIFFTSMLAVR